MLHVLSNHFSSNPSRLWMSRGVKPDDVKPSEMLHFSGLREQLAKQAQNEREQSLRPRQLEVLHNPLVQVGDQSLTGYQLLKLVNELTWDNRLGVKSNLKRAGFIGLTAFCVGTAGLGALATAIGSLFLHDFVSRDISPDMILPAYAESFRNGARRYQFDELFNENGYRVIGGLEKLQGLGLVSYSNKSNHYPGAWYLTSEGKKLLGQGGKMGVDALKAAEPKASEIPKGQHRATLVQSLLSNIGAQPATGWDLLNTLQVREQNRSVFQRWYHPGVDEESLSQSLNIPADRSELKERLPQLEQLGLIERKNGAPEDVRWRLTSQGKDLLKKEAVDQALQLTPEDLRQYLEGDLKAIEAEKKQKISSLEQLEKAFQNGANAITPLQARLKEAEQKALTTHELIEVETDPLSKEKMSRLLSDQLLAIKLLEEEIAFENRNKEANNRQLTAYRNYFDQWTKQAHETILLRNKALWQLKQQQNEQSLQDILKDLKGLNDLQAEGVAKGQLQLAELLASLKKPSLLASEETQAMLSATEAISQVQQAQAIESMQQRVKMPEQKAMATHSAS